MSSQIRERHTVQYTLGNSPDALPNSPIRDANSNQFDSLISDESYKCKYLQVEQENKVLEKKKSL